MMIVMPTTRIVRYTSKVFQVVPTSARMDVLTLVENPFASREVISPAVAVSGAFAKMVAMPDFGLCGYTLHDSEIKQDPHGVRLGWLRGLGRHEGRQHQASSGSLRLSRWSVYFSPIQLDEQMAKLHL